ncbi:MAG TPA: TlpA disulfide reductase family protein [Chitinophagaceae bacterium]
MKFKLLISALFLSFSGFANNIVKFKIEGNLVGSVKGKYAYLSIHSNSIQRSQLIRATIINGRFVFTGTAKTIDGDFCSASLFISDKPGYLSKDIVTLMKERNYDFRRIIVEDKVLINVGNSVKEAIVIDGELNDLNTLYQYVTLRRIKQDDSLRSWYNAEMAKYKNNVDARQKAEAEYYKGLYTIQEIYDRGFFDLIRQYPTARQSAIMLRGFYQINKIQKGKYTEELNDLWKIMPASYKESKDGKECMRQLAETIDDKNLKEGGTIPDYTFNPGKQGSISIKDFRGKYLFIDFWTSWCGPCRGEHHYMKTVFEKFKSQNFTIVQVSLDDKEDKWLKALKEEQLPWTNFRCLKGWDKEVEKLFDIKGVPTNYLVGPDGKIIAKNLRGEALENKLAEVLGQQ